MADRKLVTTPGDLIAVLEEIRDYMATTADHCKADYYYAHGELDAHTPDDPADLAFASVGGRCAVCSLVNQRSANVADAMRPLIGADVTCEVGADSSS